MSQDKTIEHSFSSDESFDDEETTESDTDVDAQVAEDDVFDEEFLKCYSALKKKDEKIYKPDVRFFTERDSEPEDNDAQAEKKNSAPRMTILDMQLNQNQGLDEAEVHDDFKIDLNQQISKSYYEKELEEIKKSIEQVGEEVDNDSDDELLVVKGSDPSGVTKKNKISSILDKLEGEDDDDIEHLKKIWTNPSDLSEEDKYLRDYVLNKRYLTNHNDTGTTDDHKKNVFFSENLEDLSDDNDEDEYKEKTGSSSVKLRSDETDFDKIVRIPRNSTKTIRDMVEKQEKKEKRMKKLEKEKKKKKSVRDADCEDIVGDLPTKFHYRETEPNDYGLSAEELLMATDEELDKWISLHECVAYRTAEEELALRRKFESKRHDMELKKSIFKSIYGEDGESVGEPPSDSVESKRKRAKKRKRNTDSDNSATADAKADSKLASDRLSNNQLKKKKRKRGMNHKKFKAIGVAPDRLLAYGLSKTKLKKSKMM